MSKKMAQDERDVTITKLRAVAKATQQIKDEYMEKLRIDLMDPIEINQLSSNIAALTLTHEQILLKQLITNIIKVQQPRIEALKLREQEINFKYTQKEYVDIIIRVFSFFSILLAVLLVFFKTQYTSQGKKNGFEGSLATIVIVIVVEVIVIYWIFIKPLKPQN